MRKKPKHLTTAPSFVLLGAALAASAYGAGRRPLYQYRFRDIFVPPASADEHKLDRFSPELARDYVEKSALAWTMENKCVSCHTNGSYMVFRPMLTSYLGQPQSALREFFVSTLQRQLSAEPSTL